MLLASAAWAPPRARRVCSDVCAPRAIATALAASAPPSMFPSNRPSLVILRVYVLLVCTILLPLMATGTTADVPRSFWTRQRASTLTFSAGDLTITVGADGTVQKAEISGEDTLCASEQTKLMSATISGHEVNATAVAMSTTGVLKVSFGSYASVHALVNSTGSFLVLRVQTVAGANVSDITVAKVLVNSAKFAALAAAAYGAGPSSMLFLPATLSLDVLASNHSNGCTMLSARSYNKSGLAQSVAIWGGGDGIHGLTSAIQKGEQMFDLPSPAIGGIWAKSSPQLSKGYFLMSVDPTTVNQTIEFALQSGIPYITMLVGSWTSSQGHYNVSTAWGGMEGLKAAARLITSRGLKLGLHSLSANIATHDPYVSPVPDPRLAKRAGLTLDADIGTSDAWLPLQQKPTIPNPYGSLAPAGGLDVMVDSEIMTYSHTNTSEPFGLAKVKRGAYGTIPTAHKRGAKVYYMLRSGDGFLPDPDSTLLEEVAANLAHSYNELGAEMIYCDGLEHLTLTGHFSMAKFQRALFKNLKGNILAESSSQTSYTWHLNARSGQTDWAATDSRVFMDDTKAASCLHALDGMQGPDMGWWGYLLYKQGSYYATTPSEIEYMAARAVAYGASPNLETRIADLLSNGRTTEAFSRMRPWWGLQLPTMVKGRLRQPGVDFALSISSNGTADKFGVITPVRVHAPHVAEPNRSETLQWSYQPFFNHTSTLHGVRIRALSAVAATSSEQDIDLLRLNDVSVVRTNKCQSGGSYVPADQVTFTEGRDLQQLRYAGHKTNTTIAWDLNDTEGIPSFRLNYTASSVTSVGCLRQRYATPLDLQNNTAILVKVFGDNSGALLNIELQAGEFFREFFVPITFYGWQQVPLAVPETVNLFHHKGGIFQLPAGNNAKMAMRDFAWSRTLGINFFITGVLKCNISIGTIAGRAEHPATLTRATFTAGDVSLSIPSLRGGGGKSDYLECQNIADPSTCRVFDADGHSLNHSAVDVGTESVTESSDHELSLKYPPGTNSRPRLEVTVMEHSQNTLGPFPAK